MNLDEQKHLEETLEIIKSIIDEKNLNIEDYKKSIVSRKRFLWEHQNEFYEPDLYSLMNDEDLNVSILNKDIKKVYKLYRSLENPYFSRIDFETEDETQTFYIGLTGIEKDYDIIVYDWRAQVANLYYNYGLGPSKIVSSDGVIKGTTTLKREFTIKNGILEKVYDNKIGVSDYLLQSVLANNTSEYMKNIVGTIGQEQNEIIRYPLSRNLIVEGVAGSGKTSVALHRIAYLLYNHKTLTEKNILVFSPSDIFTDYISHVLPELGEENVLSTTFKDFAENYIKGVKIESLVEFIERCHQNKTSKEKDIVLKMDYSYKEKLDSFLKEYFSKLKFTKKIGLKTKFLSSEELNSMKSLIPDNLSFYDKIEYLCEKICYKFQIDEIKHTDKLHKIINKLLNAELNPLKLWQLYKNTTVTQINYEEIFSVLYLYFQVVGYPAMGHIKLVVIDEAQDYSLWQFEFLKNIFRSATFTILGDKFQSINPYLKYNSLKEITTVFKDAQYKSLNNAYRSSKEIIEYANKILGIEKINSIREENNCRVLELVEQNLQFDLQKNIEDFISKGYKNIAIIVKSSKEKDKIEKLNLKNVKIIPVYEAKGLEYDAVIVYTEKDNYYRKDEDNLLYVAVTRALHALVVYNQKL